MLLPSWTASLEICSMDGKESSPIHWTEAFLLHAAEIPAVELRLFFYYLLQEIRCDISAYLSYPVSHDWGSHYASQRLGSGQTMKGNRPSRECGSSGVLSPKSVICFFSVGDAGVHCIISLSLFILVIMILFDDGELNWSYCSIV